jgi:hypothetical protein
MPLLRSFGKFWQARAIKISLLRSCLLATEPPARYGATFASASRPNLSENSFPLNLKRDSESGGHALGIVVSAGEFAVVVDIARYSIVP